MGSERKQQIKMIQSNNIDKTLQGKLQYKRLFPSSRSHRIKELLGCAA